jgi:methylenetetrahydrofolate reductase (NADPH)
MAKNRRAVFRLMRPGVYRPDRLIRSLANQGDGLGLVGLHVFTFNQVGPTVDWYQGARKAAR